MVKGMSQMQLEKLRLIEEAQSSPVIDAQKEVAALLLLKLMKNKQTTYDEFERTVIEQSNGTGVFYV